MPQWIYNRPPEMCQATELKFAKILNEVLADDWLVRWGYWYQDQSGITREGDFLVLGPIGGLAVFEIKSDLHYQPTSGVWHGEQNFDNPLVQLLAQHKAVIRELNRHVEHSEQVIPYVAKALVLPNSDISFHLKEFRGVPREYIVAGNDLQHFTECWKRLFHHQHTVGKRQRQIFLNTYGESIQPKSIRRFVSETDKIILQQTTASYYILDLLARNHQLVVEGGVGTGKSWLALECAKRFAENEAGAIGDADDPPGRDVLMIAYNLALYERLRMHVAKMKLKRGSITVQSVEALAAEILQAAGLTHEVPDSAEAKAKYYDETLPQLASDCLTSISTFKDSSGLKFYDALVVDEAQDHDTTIGFDPADQGQNQELELEQGWWSIYTSLLRQGWNAPMAIFGDAAQRPPFRASDRFEWIRLRKKLSQHAHVHLQQSVRYTRPIYQFLRSLNAEGSDQLAAGLRCTGALMDGPDVVLKTCSTEDTAREVETLLSHWDEQGWCTPGKVLVLYERSRIDQTVLRGLESLNGHRLKPYMEILDHHEGDCIGHSSIHKAKGLDALGVILLGMIPYEQLTKPADRFTYFMGASRARQLLAILHTE